MAAERSRGRRGRSSAPRDEYVKQICLAKQIRLTKRIKRIKRGMPSRSRGESNREGEPERRLERGESLSVQAFGERTGARVCGKGGEGKGREDEG